MAKIPFINKKYVFLQNLFYQSMECGNYNQQNLHSNFTYPFIKLNNLQTSPFQKTKLNSLKNSNLGNTELNQFDLVHSNNETTRSHKNISLLSSRKVDFFNYQKNKPNKVFLQNQKILKSLRLKPLLNNVGSSLPYKKTLFCYWLLPFIGFMSSISMMTESNKLITNSINKNFCLNKNFEDENPFNESIQIFYLKTKEEVLAYGESRFNQDNLDINSFSNLINKLGHTYKILLNNKIIHLFNNTDSHLSNKTSYLNWEILTNFKQKQSNLSATWLNSSLNLSSQKNFQSLMEVQNLSLNKKMSEIININFTNQNSVSEENPQISLVNKDLMLSFPKRLENDTYALLNNVIFPNNELAVVEKNQSIVEKTPIISIDQKTKNLLENKNKISFFPKHKISFSVLKENTFKYLLTESKYELENFMIAISNQKLKNINLKTALKNSLSKSLEIKTNLNKSLTPQFFLEFDERSYLPNFLTTKKISLSNPLSSYKKASLLLDEMIEPNFTKKLNLWINKNRLKNNLILENSLTNLQNVTVTNSKLKTIKNITTYNKFFQLKDIYSTVSTLNDIKTHSKIQELNKFQLSKLTQHQKFKTKNLSQDKNSFNIENPNLLLEKSIVFLLQKQPIQTQNQKNLSAKNLLELKDINQPFISSSNSKIKKLNKNSLYLLIFNSLTNSLKENLKDSIYFKNETLNDKNKIVLNNLNNLLTLKTLETNFYGNSSSLSNTNFSDPIIKLSHPICFSDFKKISTKELKSSKNYENNKTTSQNFIENFSIHKIMKETKTESKNLNLFNIRMQMAVKQSKNLSKENLLGEKNKTQTAEKYSHISKYLNYLAKKVQKIWLNPINSNYSKTRNPLNSKVNSEKIFLSHLKNKNNSPVFIFKNEKSKERDKQLAFVNSVNQNSSKKLKENLIKLGSFKKSLKLTPSILRKTINFHLKKNYNQKSYQFKSQLFRFEKIFRSYLSKKNTLDKKVLNSNQNKFFNWDKGIPKQRTNIFKNSSNKTFTKLPKISNLRFKTLKKLKLNDLNYLFVKNELLKGNKKHLFFIKQDLKNLDFKTNNLSPSETQSFDLSPTLYLKNRAFSLKSRHKKFNQSIINQKSIYMLKKIIGQSKQHNKNLRNFFSQNINSKDLLNLTQSQTSEFILNDPRIESIQPALNHSTEYKNLLEKRTREKKKRRKKKQRKETRRRKKRKRFYPRPSWIRFKLYSDFLKSRHFKNNNKSLSISSINFKSSGSLKNNQKQQTIFKFKTNQVNACNHLEKILWREKIYRNYKQSWTNNLSQESLKTQTSSINYQSQYLVDANYFPYFVNKDFYQISRTVLGDLKRVFWKSYWLRSNLNPYLNRVKTYLTDMKESTKNWSMYLNLRNFTNNFLGMNPLNHKFSQNLIEINSNYNQNVLNNLSTLKNFDKSTFEKRNFNSTSLNTFYQNYMNVKNYLQNCQNINVSSEKWQVAINLAEYQRIMYERIQQTVLNIRENLNLNGQIRARSSRIGRKKLLTPKPVKDFWIKFGKTITLEIPNHQAIDFYGDMSKIRRWWALNKSNLAVFKVSNKRKDLWVSQKVREQSKANKTKKIIYQMIKNFNNGLDEKTTLLNSSNFSNLLIKSLRIKPFFNRFMVDKSDSFNLGNIDISDKIQDIETKSKNQLIFEKFKRSLEMSEQKLRKKESKLSYLGFFNKKISSSSLNKTYFRDLKKQIQGLPISNSLDINSKIQTNASFNKFTSEYNYWWKGEYLSLKIIPSFKNSDTILNANVSLLLVSTFLFHFCAVISLLSSTEVRGLLKFYTILSSKIFKIYLDLIFSISQYLLKPVNSILKLNLENLSHQKFDKSVNSFSGFNENNFKQNWSASQIFQQFLLTFSFPFMANQRYRKLKETYLKQAVSKSLIWSTFKNRQKFVNIISDLSTETLKTREKNIDRNSQIQLNNLSLTRLKNQRIRSFKDPIILKNDIVPSNLLNNWGWTIYFVLNANKSNVAMLKKISFTKKQPKYSHLVYLSLLNLITKPILWMDGISSFQNKTLSTLEVNLKVTSHTKNNSSDLSKNQLITMKIINFNKLLILSSLNFIISSSYKGSFYLRTWLIKSLDIFQAILGSIYLFFEKPGELIVDWIAYAFLVEWSSDLTTTIPDTLDISTMTSYSKMTLGIRSFIITPSFFMMSPLGLTNGLVQRQMLNFYQSMVEQLCQPDTDLLIRQKKGMVFWDIWSELLIDVAEDANINISELTSLKEEQNRLLDKLEQSASSNFILFKNKSFKTGFTKNYKAERLDNNSFLMNSIQLLNVNKNLLKKEKRLKNSNFFKTKILNANNFSIPSKINQKQLTWSVNQFLSYQGKDTELFIDLHPPKSFSHLPSIKYSQSIQQPVGTIICQIFSGIFNQQIAKNILVVGSAGTEKTLLIQAIAGETELKIITDNAQRYAMVYRGVAVGIKLLRDVFEALSLHTPCIFLLEDIHHIGERRPFLISDDENTKATEFGSEKEEIHEKNQVIYQLSKHFVSHYKKPYKGDFSLLIPTNHFCFNLFLGVSSPRTRSYQVTPSNPLQFDKTSQDTNQFSYASNKKQTKNIKENILSSSLEIKSDQLLAPPATSPFSVLILKEEKKLKPKQLVKEMPWSGLPGEQLALISKSNYSIRVKIALLADMALSNVSVKLDMITDLLVIIDSVKGNRGFIVFATTHLPYILDPALRRPGRFDETVTLPLIPNLFSRWEILKTNLSSFTQPSLYSSFTMGSTIDFTNISGYLNPTFQSTKLSEKLVNFNKQIKLTKLSNKANLVSSKNSKLSLKNLTISYHLTNKDEPLINPTHLQYAFSNHENKVKINQISKVMGPENSDAKLNKKTYLKFNSIQSINQFKKSNYHGYKKPLPKAFFNLIAKTYFSMSRILTNLISNDLKVTHLNLKNDTLSEKDVSKTFVSPPIDLISFDSNIYLSLYASNKTIKEHLMHLMAGKLGELFAFSNYNYSQKFKISEEEKMLSTSKIKINNGLMSLYGIDKTWRATSSLLFSVITKRYLYNKNLMTPKLFNFSNYSSLNEAPTPPSSNILLPLKRYENYRRTFNAEQSKHKAKLQSNFLQTTLELHQQQRLVKRLYKLPIREFFKSEIITDKLTGFGNSSITLSAVEKNLMKLTNVQSYYRQRILNRHRNYLNTQWWNAQLSEHNAESTFLSDIDWRYTFVESIGDIFIDFPDSDQFYNPRNRRWILTSGSWNNWFNFEKTTLYDIYQQYTFDCFTKVYNFLDQHREILDFYAFTSLNQSVLNNLKEITMINIYKRFL